MSDIEIDIDDDDLLGDFDDDVSEVSLTANDDMMKYENVKEISKVLRSEKTFKHLEDIENCSEEHCDYEMIEESNKLTKDIETDILKVHKFIKDHYSVRFHELERITYDAVTYAKLVMAIGNVVDMTTISAELEKIVSRHTVMIIQTTGSTSSGRQLTPTELERITAACEEIAGLEEARQVVLEFVQSKMNKIAPNTSAIIGTSITSHLIGLAGSLLNLAKLSSNVIRTLGKTRTNLEGFAATTQLYHTGVLVDCDIVQGQPDGLKRKTCQLVANKVTLAIRSDAEGNASSTIGPNLREEILSKIAKWKEPKPAQKERALPAPKEKTKNKRAGRKFQRAREKFKQTTLSKKMNQMNFGEVEDEDYMGGRSLGNLRHDLGSTRIKAETKVRIKRPKIEQQQQQNGFASTLSVTPQYGMEITPAVAPKKETTSKYFGSSATYSVCVIYNKCFIVLLLLYYKVKREKGSFLHK